MNKGATVLLALAVGLAAGVPLGSRLMPARADEAAAAPAAASAAAVASAIGAQDISGPYDVQHFPTTNGGRTGGRAASSPKARTASICSAVASCRT